MVHCVRDNELLTSEPSRIILNMKMNGFMVALRLVVVVFALLTAGLLVVRVFGGISTEDLKDNVLKLALISGIITALCAVVLTVTANNNGK